MNEGKVPPRSEVAAEHTWNAASVFESPQAWRRELEDILKSLDTLEKFRGRLGEGAATLAEALAVRDELDRRMGVAYMYAGMSFHVDTTNQETSGMLSRAQSAAGRARAAASWVEPEILQLDEGTVRSWMKSEPSLAVYLHYFDDLFRQKKHVRSGEVEEVVAMLADPFSSVGNTALRLTGADFSFASAVGSDGKERELTQGTLDAILGSPDREARRTAWENYMDRYVEFRNTLASNLETSIKQNVMVSKVRRHQTTLGASLFAGNIPLEVFHNLIGTFRKNLPTWHRYWEIRRRGLGVESLHPYDIWAPLTANAPVVPYQQAVEWICQGLAPMGSDYVDTIRRGCHEERWIDLYPNRGKTAGAFSWGSHGTHPFINMSYTDDIGSLSTLAHELGHSMHSYLSWKHQPPIYGNYSLFAAEVASNFHQAMVRAHLFEANKDRDFQIAVIEEAMDNFHRYFFIMPTLARFELETHQRVEKGESITADDMIDLMVELFSEGYGGKMTVHRERVGMTWATFNHLYSDYYVYQYATGISGAHALSGRILAGEKNAVEDYRGFLNAGGSRYPIDALRSAGVDLTTPAPVEKTYAVLAGLVDRLEELLAR